MVRNEVGKPKPAFTGNSTLTPKSVKPNGTRSAPFGTQIRMTPQLGGPWGLLNAVSCLYRGPHKMRTRMKKETHRPSRRKYIKRSQHEVENLKPPPPLRLSKEIRGG